MLPFTLIIRENMIRGENTMSLVLTLIWMSVSHSSVIDAQSESGSFDVIWKALFYNLLLIFFVIIFLQSPHTMVAAS